MKAREFSFERLMDGDCLILESVAPIEFDRTLMCSADYLLPSERKMILAAAERAFTTLCFCFDVGGLPKLETEVAARVLSSSPS